MLIHQPTENDQCIITDDLVERNRTKGILENGQVNEAYHHYRHSLDDKYILWRNGQKDLGIYDVENFKNDETVENFWMYKGKQTMPVAAISNREVSKILALSQLDGSNQVIHYYEKDANYDFVRMEFMMHELFPTMKRLTTMEVSSDASVAYIAGIEDAGNGKVIL